MNIQTLFPCVIYFCCKDFKQLTKNAKLNIEVYVFKNLRNLLNYYLHKYYVVYLPPYFRFKILGF